MESGYSLRLATENDDRAIAELTNRAYEKYVARMGRAPRPMLADYHQIVREDQVWVMCRADRVAAVLVLSAKPDHLYIFNVAVDPADQGRGLGKSLIAFAEEEARRQGLGALALHTNETMVENIALYQALGYEETSREPVQGTDVVTMRKSLS